MFPISNPTTDMFKFCFVYYYFIILCKLVECYLWHNLNISDYMKFDIFYLFVRTKFLLPGRLKYFAQSLLTHTNILEARGVYDKSHYIPLANSYNKVSVSVMCVTEFRKFCIMCQMMPFQRKILSLPWNAKNDQHDMYG